MRLTNTLSWACGGSLRSEDARKVAGGLSAVFRGWMRLFFIGAQALDKGLALPVRGAAGEIVGERIYFFAFHAMVADESALKHILDVKGASGLRICLKCKNITSESSELDAQGNYIMACNSCEVDRFDKATDADLFRTNDILVDAVAQGIAKPDLVEMEKAFGMNANPHGILNDAELRGKFRPSTGSRFDGLHNLFAKGLVPNELDALMALLKNTHKITWEDLHTFFVDSGWQLPKQWHKHTRLESIFEEGRISADYKGRHSASESIAMLPIVRHWAEVALERLVEGGARGRRLRAALDSFYALARMVDIRAAVKAGRLLCPELERASIDHMTKFKTAYPGRRIKPKAHYNLHAREQIEADDGIVLDCFAHERKHLSAKAFGDNCDDLIAFSKAVLARTVQEQVVELQDHPEALSLEYVMKPYCHSRAISKFLNAPALCSGIGVSHGMRMYAGDCVRLVDGRAAFVVLAAACPDKLVVFVNPCTFVQRLSATSCKWQKVQGADCCIAVAARSEGML